MEENFGFGQFGRQRQRSQVQIILYVDVGPSFIGHVKSHLQKMFLLNYLCIKKILSLYHFLVNDQHVKDGVAVGVLVVWVGVSGQNQSIALLLAEAGGKTQRVLAPVHVAVVICQWTAINLETKLKQ